MEESGRFLCVLGIKIERIHNGKCGAPFFAEEGRRQGWNKSAGGQANEGRCY